MHQTSDIRDRQSRMESEMHRIGTAREGATHVHCPNTDPFDSSALTTQAVPPNPARRRTDHCAGPTE